MRLMGAVAENRRLARWAARLPRPPAQLGRLHETDAELLPLGDGRLLALTVDSVAEEVRLGLYRDPFTAGRVAVVAALSDLAAVGADPLGVLLSVSLPRERQEAVQDAVARGAAEACQESGTWALGGDTSEADALSVTGVAAGVVERRDALTRLGARPGDLVCVSGPLGSGSALAAARLLGRSSARFDERAWRPRPRLAEARLLRGRASACMDTSDGLLATLDQLARLNDLALTVTTAPGDLLHPAAERVRARLGLPALALLAGHHGEFELAFTLPRQRWGALLGAATAIGWRPRAIGHAHEGEGVRFGERRLDGARLRNLAEEIGSDPVAYARALCEAVS